MATSQKAPVCGPFIYAAIIIGSMAISLDFASVDLALPALESRFGLNLQSVQWVINGYVLALSVLMVAGGRIADAYGRKLVFLIGMTVFGIASLLGGMAWSGGGVVAFRVLQGVGAALLWPAMVGMACAALGDDKRAMALGLIFGSCSIGNAAGPVVGGALTEYFSWRWVLWINVPMAVITILVTLWKVPWDRPAAEKPRNDYAGMAALTFGLVALLMVVYQSDVWGLLDPRVIGLAVIAAVLLIGFPFLERRAQEPLVPLDLMASKEIRTLCLCVIVISQLFFIVLLYFTQYAMKFMGYDPVRAGFQVVQFMLCYGVVSYFGGPLCNLFGSRRLLIIGLSSAILASLMLGYFGPGGNWIAYNASLILLGIGVGAVIPTVNSRAIETVGTARASLITGITFMCQLAGSAFMLAINTVIFSAVSKSRMTEFFARENVTLTTAESSAVEDVLRGARTIHEIPASLVSEAGDAAEVLTHAYNDGLQVVLWLSAALVFAALLLLLRYVPVNATPPGAEK